MRINCPNCDAQYEVPEDVIPAEGRDVQCSSCGQTWLQHHPDHVPEKMTAEDTAEVELAATGADDTPAIDETYIETPPAPPVAQARIDPEVADILRQEAERETAARAQETGSIETQPDLGLESETDDLAQRRSREATDRMARLRGAEQDRLNDSADETTVGGEAIATAATIGARRELLPDIEEINSTLRSASDRDIAGNDPDPNAPIKTRKRRGFRRGFLLAILLIAVAVIMYVFAPDIASAVPQVDPWLSQYVAWVDGLRIGLDSQVQGVLQWLDAQAAASEN